MRTLVALFALVLLAPAATAHCAALPRDQDTRLLQDYADECKVDGGTNDCHGSDELIALDIQEKWDGSKDVAVFRYIMDKGQAGAHKDTVTVTTPKGTMSLAVQSSDDTRWANGGGFDTVSTGQGLGDGSRFLVEGTVAMDKLGKTGDPLTSVKVEADTGGSVGDYMPGTCHNAIGDCPPALGGDACYYNPTTSYKLRGPSYYATLNAGTPPTLVVGAEQIVQLDVKSLFGHASQQVTMTVSTAAGVTARFHDAAAGNGKGYSPTLTFPLSAQQSYGAHLALQGDQAGAQGVLTVALTTDLGGHAVAQIPFKVSGTASSSSSTSLSSSSSTAAKSSPPVDLPLILLGAAALAMRRRSQE